MSKALVNYIVDAGIALAFIVASVSGIVFLLPDGWVVVSQTGRPTMLGVSLSLWNTVHQWSALAMIAGVVLHVALHWRWVTMTTRRMFRPSHRVAASCRAAGSGRPVARGTAAAVMLPTGSSDDLMAALPAARAGAADLRGADCHDAAERRPGGRRVTRKAFLAGGAAAVCGAALFLALGRPGAPDESPVWSGEDHGEPTEDAGPGEAEDLPSRGSAGGSSGGQAVPQSGVARVSVDASRCRGCGACVMSCPNAVFALDGQTAAVVDAGACELCGRCVNVCGPRAITLRA